MLQSGATVVLDVSSQLLEVSAGMEDSDPLSDAASASFRNRSFDAAHQFQLTCSADVAVHVLWQQAALSCAPVTE